MAGKTKVRGGASKKSAKSSAKGRPATKSKSVSKSRPKSGAKKTAKPSPASKPKKSPKRVVTKTLARAKAKAHAAAKPRAAAVPKKPVTFAIDAPSGFDVSIAGSFNKWEPKGMTKGEDGIFRITLKLAPGTYQYKFLLDTEWREDPVNPRKVLNEYGGYNSICDVV
jgi:hypothetical protein